MGLAPPVLRRSSYEGVSRPFNHFVVACSAWYYFWGEKAQPTELFHYTTLAGAKILQRERRTATFQDDCAPGGSTCTARLEQRRASPLSSIRSHVSDEDNLGV